MNLQDFYRKFTEILGAEPTNDQHHAISKIGEFLFTQSDNPVFILRGYAGTGKSTLISALSRLLPVFKMKSVLLAPTGRAAKVIAGYSQRPAFTIHRRIYRKSMLAGGIKFSPAPNKQSNTVFIVDEASMIGDTNNEDGNNLLEDLLQFVFSGEDCKLMLVGDIAQLPPVGSNESPALYPSVLRQRFHVSLFGAELKQVVRQSEISGILYNATKIRIGIASDNIDYPKFETATDVQRINGEDLEEALEYSYRTYGAENTLVVCRSNKRANAYNFQIRARIRWQENELSAGDLLMVVKNNYFWLADDSKAGFIANGDALQINKVIKVFDMYGFHFAEATVKMLDYPEEPEMQVILLLNTLTGETPSLPFNEQKKLYEQIAEDYAHEPARKRNALIKSNPHYNALQVKFSYAVTCHKAQGGQWDCVFIDQGFFTRDMLNREYLRWLYTAFTRAKEKIYLVNFSDDFF